MLKCWTCGGNHKQQDCWKHQHVRQVANAVSVNQDGSSGFHSSQSHSNAVSSSQAPSSTTNQTAQKAPTPHRVNRAACTYNDNDEFEFDLGAFR